MKFVISRMWAFIFVNALLCIFFPQHGTTASIPQELLDKKKLKLPSIKCIQYDELVRN